MSGGGGGGGVSSGGSAGAAVAGAKTGGMGGGGMAAGGAAGAGQGGGGTGGVGGGGPATPSAGCSKGGGRPAGGAVEVANSHYFTFPESYDGNKPYPVLVAFHGCSEGNRGTSLETTEWIRLTENSTFETEYVRFVPVSESPGGCWSYNADIDRVKDMYDELLANHCVDTERVFATGHSSGAQFIVQLLRQNSTADAEHLNFRAVAPVAASDYGALAGPVAVMYIQGKTDMERGGGDGHETVEQFRAANSCGSTSMPYAPVMGCQSGNTSVNPGCIVYDGCMAPTIWCSHNDPQYGTSYHGVPCFGVKAMYDFFQSLP